MLLIVSTISPELSKLSDGGVALAGEQEKMTSDTLGSFLINQDRVAGTAEREGQLGCSSLRKGK